MAPTTAPEAPRALTIERVGPGKFRLVDPSWPGMALVSPITAEHGNVTHMGDSIRFEFDNGWGVYRLEEYLAAKGVWRCSLVDSLLIPDPAAAEAK